MATIDGQGKPLWIVTGRKLPRQLNWVNVNSTGVSG
jgi:hypothetical protein